MVFKVIVCTLLAYFIGTFQTAIIFSKNVKKQDIRAFGSGNAGSTNMLRTFGWGAGAITFLGDLLKGALAALVCGWIGGDLCMAFGGVAVLLGHIFPVEFGFKGGKGVATSFGVMLAISPLAALITFVVCAIIALVTRYVSIASLIGVLAFFITSLFMGRAAIAIMFFLIAVIVFCTHIGNIGRLLNGTEKPFYGNQKDESARFGSSAAQPKKRNLK